MESKLNIIPTIFRKLIFNSSNQSMKFIIVLILLAAVLAFIHGSIKENMLSATSIVVLVITFFITYIFVKKSYNHKIQELERTVKTMNHPTIMDDICSKDGAARNNQCIK